ncbi:hypothetical protein BAUCODRAFT_25577 [Baudoinia panamericana UAMH 10762]|uniref:Uncharacterized protein n=1 Tax=Baudoinia panamericana (strain UAMH 10762) TaxID=717646 RepID=M2MS92_BAUPA|nr:uncharacterized protein BAUCODRAFT_25577 [Baudoinia panamericana UAMH 10762]EMC94373.1 hypothetical protein BAUCODRAFT_25577 [Baudoinia panamericana UAMH 10762]
MGSMVPITSAQAANGASAVFFVNNANILFQYAARDEPEKPRDVGRRYQDDPVKDQNGNAVTCSSKDLAALAYQWQGLTSTRLYFADGDNIMQELCSDNNGPWFIGSLGNSNFQATPGTQISAHVNYNSSQLKVYFYSASITDRPSITWTTLGDDQWQVKGI